MKRRYSNEAVVQRSGGEGVGVAAVLIFSIAVLYLTENLVAAALLFVTGLLIVNGGLWELFHMTRKTKRRGSAHPLHGTRNFVSPWGEDDEDE